MFRNIITLVVTLVMAFAIAASAADSTKINIFMGPGDNLRLWKEANTFKYKNSWGVTFGASYQVADRWSAIMAYDYSERNLDSGSSVDPNTGKTLFVKEGTLMTAYLLTDPASRFRASLLGGLQITDGNIPNFGTYLGFVNGGMLSYQPWKTNGLKIYGAGTFVLGEDYQLAKLRVGLAYPIAF